MSSSNPAFYNTSNSSTSTLRPRNPRLISFIEDEGSLGQDSSDIATTTSTTSALPFPPLGGASTPTEARTTSSWSKRLSRDAAKTTSESPASIWDPWASISGIASTFLGNDGARSTPVSRSNSARKTSVAKKERGVYSTKTAKAWGPKDVPADTSTAEDRIAILQAKKRESILIASTTEQKDSLGRFKRKGSNAGSSPPDLTTFDHDDVLVYRHNISPHDTMAGVVIKYSCQPEVFRKVNRFWPNDNIQRRNHVLLPVDACSIRGKKVDEPNPFDLLAPGSDKPKDDGKAQPTPESGSSEILENGELAVSPTPASPQKWPQEENYKHDHWVLLPNFTQPTEILRLSKRNLGYFPPARRKSNTAPFADSTTSTPKSSFDMLRHPPTHAAQQAQLSQRQQLPPYLNPTTRQRSSSTMSAPLTASTAFVNVLHGPGGVGTLRGLRTEKARPGPAEDALNKKFAQYIPDLLPPSPDTRFLSPNRHHRTASSSLRVTPRASSESVRSTRSNSSSVPTAIDGWLKRMTSSGAPGVAAKIGIAGRHTVSQLGGDLIELDDTVSMGRGKDLDDPNRASEDAAANTARVGDVVVGSSKSDEEIMNERFPVRGRVTRAYEAD